MLEWTLALAVAAPLVAAAALSPALLGWTAPTERTIARISVGGALISLAAAIAGVGQTLDGGRWWQVGELAVDLTLRADLPGATLSLLSAGWTLAAARMGRDYLHREVGFLRFYLMLGVLAAGMQLIALGGNLPLVFVGWELAGFASATLIAWRHVRADAAAAGLRAFMTNRVGDAAFIAAIAIVSGAAGTLDWAELAHRDLATLPAALAWIGLWTAALAKSGQLPFSAWLSRAMEGPTPSSALFYAAVMIHAGPFLLLRAAPLLGHTPWLGPLAVAVGLLTAAYGWLVSVAQTDIKSAYVHAAMSQVGVTFALVGLGWERLALWHLVGHACLRGYQVMTSPSYRLQVDGQAVQPVPAWLARAQRLRAAAAARFWLDALVRDQVTGPLDGVARQLAAFDRGVVDRASGWPAPAAAVLSSLAAREAAPADAPDPRRGEAQPGWVARALIGVARAAWRLEDLLVHHWMGAELPRMVGAIGGALEAFEGALAQAWAMPALVLLVTAFLIGGAA